MFDVIKTSRIAVLSISSQLEVTSMKDVSSGAQLQHNSKISKPASSDFISFGTNLRLQQWSHTDSYSLCIDIAL